MKSKINKTNKEIIYTIDLDIYPLKTIYAASHIFTDRAFILLKRSSKEKVTVHIKMKGGADTDRGGTMIKRLKLLAGEFNNEILNQALRDSVSSNNKLIREYIVLSAVLRSLIKKSGLKHNQSNTKSAITNVDNYGLGLTLEKDKDLLKELKELEKDFLSAPSDFDFKNDELDIAIPWEEKFGKK